MNAVERRMEILEVLCTRRRETVDNLAFEFGVANSTIRKDISALMSSFPIYTMQGTGGGVHVVEGYYIGRKYLNEKQEELLNRLSENLCGEDKIIMEKIISSFALYKSKNRSYL